MFAAFLARLRRDHPGLRQRTYADSILGGADVSYVFFTRRRARSPGEGSRPRLWIDGSGVGAADLLVLINMADHPVTFAVPHGSEGRGVAADRRHGDGVFRRGSTVGRSRPAM